ncbi:MAG TPA: 2-amino-4-hydroxy-6-hydroxymethyldihydropteridine diphosphokinase [Longimicrobiaceae bacterium]|nr:2-amino-4-hydroxy-6-hydroxymethyldihydropteridine diphosphokinase [Longimicrobiaceae bacterium]
MSGSPESREAGGPAAPGRTPEPVLLGLGANQGDPVLQLARAVERLAQVLDVEAVSSVFRTEPVGHRQQPDFYNLVVRARTSLSPVTLLERTREVERELGRVRTFPNAPRTLDVDLLAYGERILDTPELTVPHPRMHGRAFVLVPLAEVAPGWRHPLLGRTARELLALAGTLERIERWGPLPPSGSRSSAR